MTNNTTDTIFLIACSTGCSCCSYENHYRGPYKTEEDAKRRIAYYLASDSEYWPLSSQFASRGRYYIEHFSIHKVINWYIEKEGMFAFTEDEFIEVDESGKVDNNDIERFYRLDY